MLTELPKMINLKNLELSFERLYDADIGTNAKRSKFEPGSCPSVENLSITFGVAGKPAIISHHLWIDFLRMFSGLQTLTIKGFGKIDQPLFWSSILEVMPQLRKLNLPKCNVTSEVLDSLVGPLSEPKSQLQHLEFEFSFIDTTLGAKNRAAAMAKKKTFDSIDGFMRRLSDANKSLKSLDLSLSIKQAIEI